MEQELVGFYLASNIVIALPTIATKKMRNKTFKCSKLLLFFKKKFRLTWSKTEKTVQNR